MTIRPLSRDEVRRLDARAAEELGLPTLVLMENAGRGAAEVLRGRLAPPGLVSIACGPGNNGGDGGVVARHLDSWGFLVRVAWFADPDRLAPDAAVQFRILERSGIEQVVFHPDEAGPDPDRLDALWSDADWLVDGLLGTGLTRPVDGLLRLAIESLNRSGKPVLSLDLPSGLDADTGEPLGVSVRAVLTATFVAPKLGFAAVPDCTGPVEVVDIGLPRRLLEPYRAKPGESP